MVDPNTCEHNFHFINLEGTNETYIEDHDGYSIAKSRKREVRHATFICDVCGLIKIVETQ